MASLRELQHSFAAALRDPAAPCAVRPAANLAVYRHNAGHQFRNALGISFPVVKRRVGEEYFRQLASVYRQRFPSRSGDLHWVGKDFSDFLATYLAGSEYAWLADLARLEWAREMASVMDPEPALDAGMLARFAAHELEALAFALQPSLRLMASPFPVLSVWEANREEIGAPVDQSLGIEQFMILSRRESVEVLRLTPPLFSYLDALAAGATLGTAMNKAGLDEVGLLHALRFMFSQSLVCAVHVADDQSSKR